MTDLTELAATAELAVEEIHALRSSNRTLQRALARLDAENAGLRAIIEEAAVAAWDADDAVSIPAIYDILARAKSFGVGNA